jgi:hypothetical protein
VHGRRAVVLAAVNGFGVGHGVFVVVAMQRRSLACAGFEFAAPMSAPRFIRAAVSKPLKHGKAPGEAPVQRPLTTVRSSLEPLRQPAMTPVPVFTATGQILAAALTVLAATGTAQAEPVSLTAASPASVSASPRALNVVAHGGTITIDVQAASRWEAAQALARLTHTRLHEQPEALAQTRPLTLHWRGSDPAQAWALVLGAEVSHAQQCGAGQCEVWVLSSGRTGTSAAATTLSAPPHPMPPDPPGLFPSR